MTTENEKNLTPQKASEATEQRPEAFTAAGRNRILEQPGGLGNETSSKFGGETSRADALTEETRATLAAAADVLETDGMVPARDELAKKVRAILAASPVEQHEAAPAGDPGALNGEIWAAWEEANQPHTYIAFHDGYTAALAKSAGEVAELRLQLAHVTAERNRLHNQCHDAALSMQPEPPAADERAAQPRIQRDTDKRIGLLFASKEDADAWQARASSPTAPAGELATWENARESLAIAMAGFAGRSGSRDFNAAISVLDAITELGLPLAWLRTASAASRDGTGAEGALREALGRTRGALYAIAKTYDDCELRMRALEAYEEAFDVPAQAPEQAVGPVAWDFRMIAAGVPGDWYRCASKAHAIELRKPNYDGLIEVRDLFAGPQPPAQAAAPVRTDGVCTERGAQPASRATNHLGGSDQMGEGISEAAERAAKALERERCRQFEWSDEQFEIWWNNDDRCGRATLVEEARFILANAQGANHAE
ncbi:hypothetical protein [Burkholderia stagnalis]|uniref:hypothetical protein n=1 Tax=Burkholderia stagnalis TaxID=1503054 RepID=UPI000F56D217|nr:hypothetical protein [Burkholderia stagnalis]